jgi:dipeptidyl aminopeptidase/acylaminoacyl peptidase
MVKSILRASVLVCAATFCGPGFAVDLPEPRAKDHRRVLYFIDDAGREQPVKSLADWELRRRDIITGIEATMGALPDRSALGPARYEPVPGSRVDSGAFTREKFRIDVGDGDTVPAWIMVPKEIRGRASAVLALHQTNGALGKDEVAGLGGSSNLHYGLELAQRGYVVLAPDYPTLGEYAYDFEKDRYISGSMKGIWNHMRCIDLLAARDDVDPNRIAAIGHSLGGHNAIFLAVFDPRVKAIVTSCGWTPFHDYCGGDLTGWTGASATSTARTPIACRGTTTK